MTDVSSIDARLEKRPGYDVESDQDRDTLRLRQANRRVPGDDKE